MLWHDPDLGGLEERTEKIHNFWTGEELSEELKANLKSFMLGYSPEIARKRSKKKESKSRLVGRKISRTKALIPTKLSIRKKVRALYAG